MKKTYIIDTSVIVFDHRCFESLEAKSDIYINITVLEELDNLKSKEFTQVSKDSRRAIRYLDELFESGDVVTGIKLANGTIVKIHQPNLDGVKNASYGDNSLLQSMAELGKGKKNKPILLTRDINLRVRARAAGFVAEGYEKKGSGGQDNDFYTGTVIMTNTEIFNEIETKKVVNVAHFDELKDISPHAGIILSNDNGDTILCKRSGGDKVIKIKEEKPWGIEAKNIEQALALDFLMDTKVPLTTLSGPAGCGKTLLTLAAGLELVFNQKRYKKLIIYRPISVIEGQDLGFLPGDKNLKIFEHLAPLFDNFEVLLGKTRNDWKKDIEMWIKRGYLELDSLTYIRGRSIGACEPVYLVFDEMQNISHHAAKTLLSRVQDGSKVVLTGDIGQIDTKNLDINNNGLTAVLSAFKDSKLSSHLTLQTCTRGKLAEEALKLL